MSGYSIPVVVFRSHRGFVVFAGIAAGLLQFLIIRAITGVDTGGLLPAVLDQLPERFRLMVNETLISRMSVEGAAALGFNHPIVMVLLAICAVSVAARHLSGGIEDGSLEVVLAHPVGRVRLIGSLWTAGAAMNLAVVACALAGSLAATALFHTLEWRAAGRLAGIALNLWLVSLVMESASFLVSAGATKGARTGLWTAAVLLAFYVLHFLTPLLDALRVVVPVNVFTYYQPHKLILGERNLWENVVVLVAATGAFFCAAALRFAKRDIPG